MQAREPLVWGLVGLFFAAVSACSGPNEPAGEQKAEQTAKATGATVTRAAPPEVASAPTQAPPPTEVPTAAPSPTAEPTSPPAEEESEASGAELELLGIVRSGTPSALIGFGDRQEIFRRGDSVFDHGTLKEVREDSIVLRSGGQDVTVKLAAVAPEAPPPPSEPVVEAAPAAAPAPAPASGPLSRAEAREALKELKPVLEKAEAKRVAVGGGHGLQLVKVEGSSVLAKLGLRSGDVLQEINDEPIRDLDHLPDLSAAAEGKELTIRFTREDVGLTVARPIQ